MNTTKIEFTKRKAEIDKYFKLLSSLDIGNCTLSCKKIDGSEIKQSIDTELTKILKANGFLLLYNLVEAIITHSINAIFNEIYRNELTFSMLSDKLKKLWISQKTLPLNQGIDSINSAKINETLNEIVSNVIDNEVSLLELKCVRISGNIDAQEIRIIANKIGFEESSNGRHLVTIKEKRNFLSHGEYSFTEVGRNHTSQELIEFKDDAYQYLSDVITSIENFLNERRFEKANSQNLTV
ncbi:MAG: hypothetical protein HYZ54_04400 [Ignavibacteriae bacterium]|nr:hypothetical protein [Ignavibacteriota bacterium]